MDTFLALPLPLWGGIIGSLLTYAVTYFRERRKLADAYRAPQREAVAQILAAANELKVSANDVITHSRQPILEVFKAGTSNDAATLAQRNFELALLEVERAFAVGKLTVVHPQSYRQMILAYERYSTVRRSFDTPELAQRDGWKRFMERLDGQLQQLDADCAVLVAIGQDHLSPKQGLLRTAARKGVQKQVEDSKRAATETKGP